MTRDSFDSAVRSFAFQFNCVNVTHLELGAVACAQLLVELVVERRLAREEVDRSRAVDGEGPGAGGDGAPDIIPAAA